MTLGIVVPTFNRQLNLDLLLTSLEKQNFDGFTAVVADDGSMDGTREMIDSRCARWNGRLLWVGCGRQRGVRTGRARNIGAANLAGDVTGVLFLDSDLVSQPHAVQAFANLHRMHPESVIFGPVEWLPKLSHAWVKSQIKESRLADLRALVPKDTQGRVEGTFVGPELRPGLFERQDGHPIPIRSEWALSLNCLWPVQAFWSVGGFDESMLGYGYEDNELGARAANAGMTCLSAPDLWSLHVWHSKPEHAMWENQQNLDHYLRTHSFNPIIAADIDWTFWFHYHAERHGRLVRYGSGLWAVDASGRHRLSLPHEHWGQRLGHCVHEALPIEVDELLAMTDHGIASDR
jgi:validoxylamine A glucosyltransferase